MAAAMAGEKQGLARFRWGEKGEGRRVFGFTLDGVRAGCELREHESCGSSELLLLSDNRQPREREGAERESRGREGAALSARGWLPAGGAASIQAGGTGEGVGDAVAVMALQRLVVVWYGGAGVGQELAREKSMVRTRNQEDPESSQQGANAESSLAQTESKFSLLGCTDHQKMLFAAQQLQGSTSAWWTNYEASLPTGRRTEWNEFKAAFYAHFIPPGFMQSKFQEFMDLKQGGRNVLQYSEAFNHLAQYATEYVNIEDKKRYAFLRGMNATLKERLTW
ncbi:hypothetical protein PR202_gb29233 [Eleusine coracana subsp. coracana]|uniref:Retrotransposon gag domain-containing protein n=1 Tax=Eleusine coracana subsp. coracana TaxID=191504 RepID=A0AAV5G0T8_ELECO|nr:hypothetical protein PR202_gb29233 [Eleusine coracana subsp. coracana]